MPHRSSKTFEKIIRQAIAGREVLLITYDDVERVVQPHIFGYDRGDHLALSAWQSAGTGVGWRLFHLGRMMKLSPAGSRFVATAPGYNPDDPSFVRVLARIEPSDPGSPEGTKSGRRR